MKKIVNEVINIDIFKGYVLDKKKKWTVRLNQEVSKMGINSGFSILWGTLQIWINPEGEEWPEYSLLITNSSRTLIVIFEYFCFDWNPTFSMKPSRNSWRNMSNLIWTLFLQTSIAHDTTFHHHSLTVPIVL